MKSILNYEGLYSISSSGTVISLERTVVNKNGNKQKYPKRILKQELSNKGYYRVTLCKQGKVTKPGVHRLIAQAFIPNPENKPYINHIDNDPTNNAINNLEWCKHSENMLHAQKQERLFKAQSKGGKNGGKATKLADKISTDMLNTVQGNWYVIDVADKRNSKQYFTVKCICCGNTVTREKSYLKNCKTSSCIKCKKKEIKI